MEVKVYVKAMRPIAAFVLLSCAAVADPLADRARAKFERISAQRVAPGSAVSFSPEEISAWMLEEQRRTVSGIRNLAVSLGDGSINFECIVNLVELAASFQQPLDPISALFVQGEHRLRLGLAVNSGEGRARVSLAAFDYDGGPAPEIIRERMVSSFLSAYPSVKLNQDFALSYNVEQVRVDGSGIRVSFVPRAGAADGTMPANTAPAKPSRPTRASAQETAASSPPATARAGEQTSYGNPQTSSAPPPVPGPSAQQLNDASEALMKMQSRAEAVYQSLGDLERQQHAAGYGLRGDMVAARSRLVSYLQMIQRQIESRDLTGIQHNFESAEAELGKLEKFLGL